MFTLCRPFPHPCEREPPKRQGAKNQTQGLGARAVGLSGLALWRLGGARKRQAQPDGDGQSSGPLGALAFLGSRLWVCG